MRLGFVERLKISNRLENANKKNVVEFLEMIVHWVKWTNVFIEEDCMLVNFG